MSEIYNVGKMLDPRFAAHQARQLAERACWALLNDDVVQVDMVDDLEEKVAKAIGIATTAEDINEAIDIANGDQPEKPKGIPITVSITVKPEPTAAESIFAIQRKLGFDGAQHNMTREERRLVEHCAALADEHRGGSEIRRLILGQKTADDRPWPDEVIW